MNTHELGMFIPWLVDLGHQNLPKQFGLFHRLCGIEASCTIGLDSRWYSAEMSRLVLGFSFNFLTALDGVQC